MEQTIITHRCTTDFQAAPNEPGNTALDMAGVDEIYICLVHVHSSLYNNFVD
jgi:hypothetical protein